ncbi:MAG TPA: ABC transporter permease [Gemmatimonadales bacterium]
MRKVLAVIRREFVERVRTKWFWVGTFLGPLLLVGIIGLQIFLATRSGGERRVAVVDRSTTGFGARAAEELERAVPRFRFVGALALRGDYDSLTQAVIAKELDGFLIIGDSTLERGSAEYRGSNASSLTDMETIQRALGRVVFATRLERSGIDPALVREAEVRVNLATLKITGSKLTTETGEQAFGLAFGMAIVLYMAIILYGVAVMSSVLEEKTTRIVEVLVSSLRPFQLMLGKVVGAGAVGLVQLGVWATSFLLLTANQRRIVGLLGSDSAGSGFQLPQVSAATFLVFLTYFLLGYFLYAAIFAAVGAMSSSEQEARQVQAPVTFILVVPYVSFFGILNDPHGGIATWMSLFPLFSPIAAPVRWAASPIPFPQLAASLIILLATVIGVTWAASRIYRVGILMTGKRPTFKEIVRWVRVG